MKVKKSDIGRESRVVGPGLQRAAHERYLMRVKKYHPQLDF